jgi:hypothetical protein
MSKNKYKHPSDEDKLVMQLEKAGWPVGGKHDDDADIVRHGDLIRPLDDDAAVALYQGQLGAPINQRGEPKKDIWWVHVDQWGEYYYPDKPRSTRSGEASPTFPIERTVFGDGFWIERSIVEPRGWGWVAMDGNIWLRRRLTRRKQ